MKSRRNRVIRCVAIVELSLGKVSAMIEALVASVIGSTLKDNEVFGHKLSRCFDSACLNNF